MAVYTDVSADDLDRFVAGFDIGEVVLLEGIAHGTENSNFRLLTTTGPFVLTLYEKRVDPADLPFFLGLMRHLSEAGFPCPAPIADRDGEFLHQLSDRPAAVVAFASGDWPREITAAHCREVGAVLAKLHVAAAGFPMTRVNDQALKRVAILFANAAALADELRPASQTGFQRKLRRWKTAGQPGFRPASFMLTCFPTMHSSRTARYRASSISILPVTMRWHSTLRSA